MCLSVNIHTVNSLARMKSEAFPIFYLSSFICCICMGHPSFANLFQLMNWLSSQNAILCSVAIWDLSLAQLVEKNRESSTLKRL